MKPEPTTLASDGFVADEAEGVVETIRTRYAAHFALIAQLNRLLTAAQYKLQVDSRSAQQLTCAALFVRALAHCQATMVLIERGVRPSARAIMRCALEALFNLGACASDHRLALAFVDSHLLDRKRLGRYLSQVSASETKAVLEVDIDETLKVINADIESVGATERRTRAMAKAAGLEDIYLTGYSLLSGAVHSTVGDLEQHFRENESEGPMELLTEPATEGLNEELELLAAVMSGLAEPVDKVFELGLSVPCESLNDSIQALSKAG